MTIYLFYRFTVGFGAASLVAVLIIFFSSLHQRRSTAWGWFRSALICFSFSALMGLLSVQASIASKANGESMSTTYEKYCDSVGFLAGSLGFGVGGALAAAVSGALLLSLLVKVKSTHSSQAGPRLPEQMD